MRQLILTIIFILTLSSLNAQFGWQIGYINSVSRFDNKKIINQQLVNNPSTGYDWEYTYETFRDKAYESGIQGGITYDLKFNRNLSVLHLGLLPAITYSTFNIELTNEYGEYISTATIKTFQNALEIPIELVGVIPQSKDINIIVFIGPTVSVGLFTLGNDSEFGWFTSSYGQRLNIEFGGGIGIQYKKATIKGAYDWGVLKYGSNNTSYDGLKISLGFNI